MAEELKCPVCGMSYDFIKRKESFARIDGLLVGIGIGLLIGFLLMFWKFGEI